MEQLTNSAEKLTLYMDQSIVQNVNMFSNILECEKETLISDAIKQYLSPFLNSQNEFTLIPAILINDEKAIVSNCHLIEKFQFREKSYSKIIINGKIKYVDSQYVILSKYENTL